MGKTKIIWTEAALSDVDQIGVHIALDSIANANDFSERLLECTDRLEDFPLSGSEIPENPSFRHVVVSGYRVIYRILKSVEIIAVIAPGRDAAQIIPLKKK